MGEILEIAKVLVSPCEKLMTMVGGAIGKAYEPRHTRKMADAHAYELSTIGAAMRELADINTTYENGNVALFTEDFQRLMQRTQNRMALQEITRQQNIESVVDKAYDLLENENEVTDEPVDQDWTRRFFNITGDISNSEMQEVWARILSGEIKRPGSFSMRTLETIRNISTEEAQTFQKIIPLILHNGNAYFVLSDSDILTKCGSSFADMQTLDDCGLMDSSGTLSLNLSIRKDKPEYLLSDTLLIAIKGKKEESEKIRIGIHTLTRAGLELFNILVHETNQDYTIQVANHIFLHNAEKVSTSVHKLVSLERDLDGEKFQYEVVPLAAYSKETTL